MKKLLLLALLTALLGACQKQSLELANTDAPADSPEYTAESNKMD